MENGWSVLPPERNRCMSQLPPVSWPGLAFLVLILALIVYIILVNRHLDSFDRVFIAEMALCVYLLFLALAWTLRLFRLVGWGLTCAGLAPLLAALCALIAVLSNFRAKPDGVPGRMIVLGLQLPHGRMPLDLEARLRCARNAARQNPGSLIVLSGGNGNDARPAEAAAMRDWLLGEGIAVDRLLVEDRSVDTEDNFRKCARLIPAHEPLLIVTSDYHVFRARKLAAAQGFSKVQALACPSSRCLLPANLLRETVALLYQTVTGAI